MAPDERPTLGWDQQGAKGAQAAADSIGAELEMAGTVSADESHSTPILHQLGDDGAQLIIAQASGYGDGGARSPPRPDTA